MKKSIALLFGLALLTGCGTVDEVPIEPLKVEESTGTTDISTGTVTTSTGTGTGTATTVSTASTTKSSGGTATFVTNTTTSGKAKSGSNKSSGGSSSTKTTAAQQQSTKKTQTSQQQTQQKPQQTTPPATEAPAPVTTRAIQQEKFVVIDEGISFKTEDGRVQRLTANTSAILSAGGDPVSYIIERDLDSDSHPDLFVPENVGTANVTGKYFRFNSDTGMYESWHQLNSIGKLMTVNSDGTLNAHIQSDPFNCDDYVYAWGEGGVIYEKQHKKLYMSGADAFYDVYSVEGGTETLVSHEKAILDSAGNFIGTEPILPDEPAQEETTSAEEPASEEE